MAKGEARLRKKSARVISSPLYRDRTVALLTQHGKEHIIAPVLGAALGCRVERVGGYDTDLLGTFTRDIPRAGTQLEAARKKARLGMQLAGLPLGLASEGAFGPDPITGLFPWNVEFLLWIDDSLGLEVVGRAHGKANFAHALVDDWAAVETFARQWGFPEHHMVLRPAHDDDPRIRKGINHWTGLQTAFAWAQGQSPGGQVFVENDVRAHANPTRRQTIGLAAADLAARLGTLCPACRAPGFWIVGHLRGLPCAHCGAPTEESRAEVHGCVTCLHQVTHQSTHKPAADPARCNYCNP